MLLSSNITKGRDLMGRKKGEKYPTDEHRVLQKQALPACFA
jgi:hypothetical protein